MPDRFVILHHTGHGDEHWDLMLERGNSLVTWQLLSNPLEGCESHVVARQIGDHRMVYLEFEGPVSGGRGQVSRLDQGTLSWVAQCDAFLRFRLDGIHLRGEFQLACSKIGTEWVFSRSIPI